MRGIALRTTQPAQAGSSTHVPVLEERLGVAPVSVAGAGRPVGPGRTVRAGRIAVDVGRVLIRLVVVADDEVATEVLRHDTREDVERKMEEVVAAPVDDRRHDIERDSAAGVLERGLRHLLPVAQHRSGREVTAPVEEAVHHHVVVVAEARVRAKHVGDIQVGVGVTEPRRLDVGGRDVAARVPDAARSGRLSM